MEIPQPAPFLLTLLPAKVDEVPLFAAYPGWSPNTGRVFVVVRLNGGGYRAYS
jgi:hypothetical protein